jgi:hypothetical protein
MSETLDLDVNFDRKEGKQILWDSLKPLRGMKRVRVETISRKSNQQMRYYRGVVVKMFGDWARGEGNSGRKYSNEQMHVLLANEFLTDDLIHPDTGEVIGTTVLSTADLNTADFTAYIEQCRDFIFDIAGVRIPDPTY